MWWLSLLAVADWKNWYPNVTDSQVLAPKFSSTTVFSSYTPVPCVDNDTCVLSQVVPLPAEQVCDCQSETVRWARMQLTDDLVEKITGTNPVPTDRCEYVSLGWTWDVSPDDTQDIVMTMNPGGVQSVQYSGKSLSFLGSSSKVRGEPCGIVYPDVFQGTPIYGPGETLQIFPGSVPVSDYCLYSNQPSGHTEPSFQDGVPWQEDWSTVMIEGLGAVDAVCRCALGRVGAMLEMSGVFFTNPTFTQNITSGTGIAVSSELITRAGLINTAYHWRETPHYYTPLIFYCREDYVLYWNLMLAYEAIYNVTSPLHPIWLDSHAMAIGARNASYWRRFNALGVDCLVNIPISSVDNPCAMEGGKTVPFLQDVGVILDIGQLFRAFDLVTWCNVSAETHVTNDCASDFAWSFASSYRRGLTWPTSTMFTNITFPYNPVYSLSIPEVSVPMVYPVNDDPFSNFYQYAIESSALFVRIVAYSDIADWSVDLFDLDHTIPAIRGAECNEKMVSGDARFGPASTAQNMSQSYSYKYTCDNSCGNNGATLINCANTYCEGRDYNYCTYNSSYYDTHLHTQMNIAKYPQCGHRINISYTNSSDAQSCPGAYPIYSKTFASTFLLGYCLVGKESEITTTPLCPGDCGPCNNVAGNHKGYGSEGWQNCGNLPPPNEWSSDDPCESGYYYYNLTRNPYACVNYQTEPSWTYCIAAASQFIPPQRWAKKNNNDPPAIHWNEVNGNCGQLVESCGPPFEITVYPDWVGERYIPVLGNPRMRGMMPRTFYNMSDGPCDCTVTNSMCFNSGLSNYCTMYMPRPAAAGIFARGVSPTALDYRAVFFDPMLETLFGEAGDAAPYVTPPSTAQFNGASAVFGNASTNGYGGPLYAKQFCVTFPKSDFCQGVTSSYSLHMLTQDEHTTYSTTTQNAFASLLAQYYATLVQRSALNVGPWFDTYFNFTPLDLVYPTPFPATMGTSVDYCFLVGWCDTSAAYVVTTSGKPIVPLYVFAHLAKPSFGDITPQRAAFYTRSSCESPYCATAGAWKGDPSIPFYMWNNYQVGTPFGWGEYKPLLQQVLTWSDNVYSFSTEFTDERRMFGTSASTRPKAAWCWKSGRGYVNDLQASLLGMCITQESCYQSFALSTKMTGELGCISNFNSTGWSQVNVVDNVVQWGVPHYNNHTTHCWEQKSARMCIMPPGQNPPSFRNENFLIQASNVSAENSPLSLLDVTAATCGCDPSIFDTIDSPTWMCRVNSLSPTTPRRNGDCYIRTNSTCDDGDFNCGSQFTHEDAAFYNLCQNCPTISVPTVGQCKNAICLGILNNGSCPQGASLCTITHNSFAAGQGSLLDAVGDGTEFLWYNGTTHNFFENLPSMMSTVTADLTVPDPVHCTAVTGPENTYANVEKSKYLTGNTLLNNGPGGLTEAALEAWCGAGDCTANRQWLCVDKGQSLFNSAQQCRLRRSWTSTYYSYYNALKVKVGYYGDTSTAQLMPDCASWVSGIDDDSACQNSEFTGCVISRVGRHLASMTTNAGGDFFRGSMPTSAWTLFGSSLQPTYNECQKACFNIGLCIAWYHDNTTCFYYNSTDWSFQTGTVNSTAGSVAPITGGFFVPRTNAGPVFEMLSSDVLPVYDVSGMDVFASRNGITVQFKDYKAVNCFGTFYYYGGSPIMLRNTSVTSCSIVSNISAYETPKHTFPTKPLIVRVTFAARVVGFLTEGTGFDADIYTQGVTGDTINGKGRGLRGALRLEDGPFVINLSNNYTTVTVDTSPAGWIFGDSTSEVASPGVMRTLRRVCVPITVRQTVNINTLDTQTEQLDIIRTDPVDCIVAGSNENNDYVNNVLYSNGGICSGTQQLEWPGGNNNVAKLSTLHTFSWWNWVMSESEYPAPIFYNPSLPGSVPNCGTNTANCELAYDIIGYTPCTDVTSSIWFTCMKPTMQALYPLYDADFSYELSTPFLFPNDLYVTAETVMDLTKDSSWVQQEWSQYITMVHYCDRYSYDSANLEEDDMGTNGWKKGKFVACDNDPFTNEQRVEFCRTKQPWWVITGLIFTQFSLNDLCPFLAGSANKYCFVFADHPMYPTVSALMSAVIDNTWDDTTFYYVPFTLQTMQYLLFNPHVVNTLITNNMFTPGVLIDKDIYGPAASQFVNHPVNICQGQITVDSIMNIYNVIQSHYEPGTDTYTFGLTSESTDSTVTIPATPPIFSETSALLQYNGLTLMGLGPPARIGSTATVVVNQIRVCTRFQIDGSDIVITNFIFDQSKCYLTGAAQQTPIVFSGAFGNNVVIHNITVIDSAVAVAVLGGDSLVYTYSPIIDVDKLNIYDISFQYTTSTPPGEKYTVAVLGRSSGVPTIAYCTSTPENYTVLPNCVLVADVQPDGSPDCAMPNQCIYDKNGCCGRNSNVQRTFGCEYGLTCTGNATDVLNWYQYQPNGRIMCNRAATGCSTGVQNCISLVGSNCYFNRSVCSVTAAEDIAYTDSNNNTLNPMQSWQYYTPASWYEVPLYPSARYPPNNNFVDGIGYEQLVWTLQGNTTQSPLGFQVIAQTLPSVPTDPLQTITIIPQFKLQQDSIAQDTTKLVLMTDWFISQKNLNTTFVDLVTKDWCIGVAGSQLQVMHCDSKLTDWYFDAFTGSVHIASYPHMCVTGFGGPLYWLPCLACHVGIENTILSDLQPNKTQLFYNNNAVTVDGFVSMPSTNASYAITYNNIVGYYLDENFLCLTYSTNITWEPCRSDYMFPLNSDICPIRVGILRYACTQGYGGSILEAALVDPACVFETENIVGNGVGATLQRQNNGSITVVNSGDGYMNGEIATAGSCDVVVYTPKVLVQPTGDNFSLASSGVEVIDLSTITGVLGSSYEAQAISTSYTLDLTVNITTIFLGVILGIQTVILFAACWYKQRSKRKLE